MRCTSSASTTGPWNKAFTEDPGKPAESHQPGTSNLKKAGHQPYHFFDPKKAQQPERYYPHPHRRSHRTNGTSVFLTSLLRIVVKVFHVQLVGDFQLAREHLHEPGLVEPAQTLQRDQRHGMPSCHRLGRRGAHHTLVGCQRIEEGDYVVPRWLHHDGKSGHRPEGSKRLPDGSGQMLFDRCQQSTEHHDRHDEVDEKKARPNIEPRELMITATKCKQTAINENNTN